MIHYPAFSGGPLLLTAKRRTLESAQECYRESLALVKVLVKSVQDVNTQIAISRTRAEDSYRVLRAPTVEKRLPTRQLDRGD
jgi:hypothetical protein